MGLRRSSLAYVEDRMARWRRRTDERKGAEADARRQAETEAARLEAMGSIYDPEQHHWAPIRLRINPRRGPARREAWEALRFARATAGGEVDYRPLHVGGELVEGGFWTIYRPDHGHMGFVNGLWDRHYYEAVPLLAVRRSIEAEEVADRQRP